MSKLNISLNNNTYSIDESELASANTALRSHFSTVMNGTGATINFCGTVYNIDSVKLVNATNSFVSHFDTISGSDSKVVVGGVEYSIGSDKIAGAISELATIFRGLQSGNGGSEFLMTAGLYETGTKNLIKSWDEMISDGNLIVNDGVLSNGVVMPDNLPEKNEYGFYYGVPYGDVHGAGAVTFNEDGSMIITAGFESNSTPAGSVIYSNGSIDLSALDMGVATVVANGAAIASDGEVLILGSIFEPSGDLHLPNDNTVTSIGDEAFVNCSNLTSVVIGDGVTSIGYNAFYCCTSLTSVVISNSVISIGERAFIGCDSLTSVVIGDGVESIGGDAFYTCESLTNITFEGTTTQWNVVTKDAGWDYLIPATYVQCSDGQVAL